MRAGVPSAFSSRRARKSGDGRHSFKVARTSSGISIQRARLTSCLISSIGKSGARSCGPIGWPVPGCRTGGAGDLKSAWMLYHFVGMSFSSRRNFVRVLSVALAAMPASLMSRCGGLTLSQSLRHEDPARARRIARDLAEDAPAVPLVEPRRLKADGVEHRRAAATSSPLVFRERQDAAAEAAAT